jgi:hypothetical protein
MKRPYDPYGGEITVHQPAPHNLGGATHEQYGGKVQEQIDMARKALNYPGRFQPPTPGPSTTNDDAERWSNVERASGSK